MSGAKATAGGGQLGRVNPNGVAVTSAMLYDRASRRRHTAGIAFHHQFEVVAMRIWQTDKVQVLSATVLGVLTWGYQVNEEDPPVLNLDMPKPFEQPSPNWIAAASNWNFVRRNSFHIPGDSATWSA